MKQRPFNPIALRRGWLIAIASSFVVLAWGALMGSAAQVESQKRVTSVRVGSTTEGSRVVVVSDSALNDYEAYRRGDRFYVKLPAANLTSAQSGFRGTGFEDAQVQKVADGVILSFRLQPGTTARVDQRLNKLDVVFSTSGLGRSSANVSVPSSIGNNSLQSSAPGTSAREPTRSAAGSSSGIVNDQSSGQGQYPHQAGTPQNRSALEGSNSALGLATTGAESQLSPVAQTQRSPRSGQSSPTPGLVAGSQAEPLPGGAVGAWLSRYWFVPLIALVLLVALVFIMFSRKRSRAPQQSSQPVTTTGEAETTLNEVDIAVPSLAPAAISPEGEIGLTVEQLPTVPVSPEPVGIIEEQETLPPMNVSHSLETGPLIKDPLSTMLTSTTLPPPENDWRSGEGRRQLQEEALLNAVEELERRSQAAEAHRRRAAEGIRPEVEEEIGEKVEAAIRIEEEAPSPSEPVALHESEEEVRPETEIPNLTEPEGEAHFGPGEELRFRQEAEALRRAGEERARKRAAAEAARRLADEDAHRREEEVLRRQAQDGTRGRVEEAIRRRLEEEARQAAEQEALRRVEDERLQLEAEERRRFSTERLRLEQEALMEAAAELTRRRSEAEEARKKAEEEARLLQETKQRIQAEEVRRRQVEEERIRLEEEARRRAEEERQRLEDMRRRVEVEQQNLEETRLRAAQEEQRLAELEAVKKEAEQRTQQCAEQETRIRAEIEALRQAELEQRKRIETETLRRAEAETRLREEEARREAAEQARLKLEEEAQRLAVEAHQRAEQEINLRAAAEASLKEEEARRRAAEEAQLRAEEEAHRLADEEAMRRAGAAARLKEEEARQHFEEEERRRLEEKSQRLAEEARLRAEQEADRRAAAEARLKEERARRQSEEVARNQTEESALRLAEEARRRKDEEVRRRLEAEARLIDEEMRHQAAEERFRADMPQVEENHQQSNAEDQQALVIGGSADVSQSVEAPWIDVAESFSGDQLPPADPIGEQVPAPESTQSVEGTPWRMNVEPPAGDGKVPADLLKRVASNELAERAAALKQLAQINSDEAFTIVSNAFDDDAVEVRNAAAQALYDMQSDRAASFTRALREGPPERRRKIGSALATSGLAGDAIANLTGESREQTYDAFSLLFLMAKSGEVQPLLQAIEDHPNIEVRLAVIKLLALSGQPEVIPAFRRLAVRGSLPSEVRSAVMEAIYQITSQARESAPSAA